MVIQHTGSSDIQIFEESEWSIVPLNIPVLLIEPPDVSLDINEATDEQILPGDIVLVSPIGARNIDMLTHQTLLAESLIKHRETWKTLAKL